MFMVVMLEDRLEEEADGMLAEIGGDVTDAQFWIWDFGFWLCLEIVIWDFGFGKSLEPPIVLFANILHGELRDVMQCEQQILHRRRIVWIAIDRTTIGRDALVQQAQFPVNVAK